MKRGGPPEWPLQILRRFCPTQNLEEIEGDLLQRYARDYSLKGPAVARRKFVKNALLFFRPEIVRRRNVNSLRPMFVQYNLKLVLRNISKHKTLAAINLTGLSIAITISLFTAQFALFEFSFDRSSLGEESYRVDLSNATNGVFQKIEVSTVSGLAYEIKEQMPGVNLVGRLSSKKVGLILNKDLNFEQREDDIVMGDAAVLPLLAMTLKSGAAKSVLSTPDKMLISESAAIKYFGKSEVTGAVLAISIDGRQLKPYIIDGVFDDIPLNRHQRFNFLLAIEDPQAWNQNWSWSNCFTYISVDPKINRENLESAFASIVKAHHHPVDGKGDRYLLEAISDIRLRALDGTGRIEIVYFFIALAIIILLLAWFNNINLAIARAFEAVREVGIRKMTGGSRSQVFVRVIVEAVVYHTIAIGAAFLIFTLTWPHLSTFVGDAIAQTILQKPETYLISAVFTLLGSFVIGVYPATIISSIKPVHALSGNAGGLLNKSLVRRSIVTIQLSVTIALVFAVLIINRQIRFMREQDLGINIDQTLVVKEPLITDDASISKYEILRDELLAMPGIAAVTYASSFPGAEIDWHRADIGLGQEASNDASRFSSRIISIGSEFMETFGVNLLAGRNFNPLLESDKRAMIISEKASLMFGFRNYHDALGKEVFVGSRNFEVVGVVNNYHYRSFQTAVEPLLYIQGYPRNPAIAIKLSSSEIINQISAIEFKWKKAYMGNVFIYYFLNDVFDQQYQREDQLSMLTGCLTVIAIVISCSGIFALSLYEVSRRTKEIGIRKVMGASTGRIVNLISNEFIRMVFIAAVVGLPVVFVSKDIWLARFAYRAAFSAWLMVIPVCLVMLLVLSSIAIHTVREARRSPADSMRHS